MHLKVLKKYKIKVPRNLDFFGGFGFDVATVFFVYKQCTVG